MVGQTGNTLTCDVSGADNLNPTITYEWIRNGETVPDGSSRSLNLSPLQLSHAGDYVCHVTVSSTLLNNDISASSGSNQSIIIHVQSEYTTDDCKINGKNFYNNIVIIGNSFVCVTLSFWG